MGAKSSLTVPLIWHEQTIGTFNVESPHSHAFNNDDMRFLEIFCRDVAASLNNLELLATQKANAAQQSVEAIHSKVALPIDEILNDIVNIVENNIGLDADVSARLLHILRNARDIKTVIQDVGRELAPAEAVPATGAEEHPKLVDKRVLVVDKDETVRCSAHTLLERYGCIVETATTGKEAAMLVRMSLRDAAYDLILCAMKLPDMSAHGLMCRLKEMMDPVPLILMSEVGWDPDHTLPNCRKSGLHPKAVLVKPFRVNQLFPVMECVLDATSGARQTQNA
jgi:CheY-like chemotaxis protein